MKKTERERERERYVGMKWSESIVKWNIISKQKTKQTNKKKLTICVQYMYLWW